MFGHSVSGVSVEETVTGQQQLQWKFPLAAGQGELFTAYYAQQGSLQLKKMAFKYQQLTPQGAAWSKQKDPLWLKV